MKGKDYDLSDRKKELLLSAVESYIENALPITSEKVHKNLFNNLSSATLRNELSTLEEMGFLKQLHTSSGRVPTTKAYRYFVNNTILNKKLNPQVIDLIKNKFINRSAFLVDMLNEVAKSINEITNFPTFIQMSGREELVIKGINIIPLITGQGLVLIQTNVGILNNTINLSSGMSEENCKDASKFLTNNFYNKSFSEVINNFSYYNNLFKKQISFYQELFLTLTNMLKSYAESKTSFVKNINTTKLLESPEYKNIDNAKKFLNLIENESEIKNIIEQIDENDSSNIVFSIGDENKNEEFSDYSIIKANYSLGNGVVASIGVVGPERMDYAKIASALKYITDEMQNISQFDDKEAD